MQGQDILNNLNLVSEKLFKSIEGQAYKILDDIVYIDDKILKKEPLDLFLNNDKIQVFNTLARSLIMIYIIYYIVTQLISIYNGESVENVYIFIIKLLITSLLVNNSYFICETLLNIFGLVTNCMNQILESMIGIKPSFENLKETILSIDEFMKSDLLSVDGIIKSAVSFSMISVLINFSVRYVKIIFLIIISPFSFCMLASDLTNEIFNSWVKQFIINMSSQVFVKLIISIPLMYKSKDTLMFKIVLIGTIYIIYRLNDLSTLLMQNIKISKR